MGSPLPSLGALGLGVGGLRRSRVYRGTVLLDPRPKASVPYVRLLCSPSSVTPERTAQSGRESFPGAGGWAAVVLRGPRSPSLPACLFGCQRTYPELSLPEDLTCPGALRRLGRGSGLCFYTCTNSTALPGLIYSPIKGSVFFEPPALPSCPRLLASAGMRRPEAPRRPDPAD